MLLIWDRDYGADGGMISAGKRLTDDAEWVDLIDGFHHYRKLLGDWQTDYYLNFGPDEVNGDEPNRYYYVKMTRYEPIEIAGAKKTPGLGCSIHSVHDGIAAQLTIHGSNCEIKNFDLLYAALGTMFQSWRR